MPVAYLYDVETQRGDLRRNGANLIEDDGLESAIHISLLTNRRADPGDQIPEGLDPQGWCLDYMDEKGRRIGSKLWMLSGQKLPPGNLNKAAQWARESLVWMIEDGITDQIETTARRIGDGVVGIEINIHRPGEPADRWRPYWLAVDLATLTGT